MEASLLGFQKRLCGHVHAQERARLSNLILCPFPTQFLRPFVPFIRTPHQVYTCPSAGLWLGLPGILFISGGRGKRKVEKDAYGCWENLIENPSICASKIKLFLAYSRYIFRPRVSVSSPTLRYITESPFLLL